MSSQVDLWRDPGVPWSRPTVDWSKHYIDVRRIFFAHFGSKCSSSGLDPEDVLQDVFEALIRYDKSNPWNPVRGALSTYIHKVCRSKFSHANDRARRRTCKEAPGHLFDSGLDEECVPVVPGGAALLEAAEALQERLTQLQGPWHPQLPQALVEGWTDKRMRVMFELKTYELREQRAALREALGRGRER